MLDTPCSEVVWRVLATHCNRQFPLNFPSHASPCATTFQLESTTEKARQKVPFRHTDRITLATHNTIIYCIVGFLRSSISPWQLQAKTCISSYATNCTFKVMCCKLDTTIGVTVTKHIIISIRFDMIFLYSCSCSTAWWWTEFRGSIQVTSNGWFTKCVLVVIGDGEDITNVIYCELNSLKYSHYLTLHSAVVTICTASSTFNNSTFCPHSYIYVLFGSENKQRLCPYTTLTDWFL